MSEKSALAFRKLVAAMRTTEKEYWAHRDRKLLEQSIELEKRVDEIIMKADGSDVPQNDNGTFFLEVAQLRATTKQYFHEKKKPTPNQDTINQLYQQIKSSEAIIDKMIIKFQDEQALKDGYIIKYHVMERYAHAKVAHSIYESTDEQLAKIELNHYHRRSTGGVLYFMAKKYVKVNK